MMAEYRIIVRDKRERFDFPDGSSFQVSDESKSVEISEVYLKKNGAFHPRSTTKNSILLPLHGEVIVDLDSGDKTVWPSEVAVFSAGESFKILSGEEELSRFIVFEVNAKIESGLKTYSSELRNELQFLQMGKINLVIGIFDGRQEAEFNMKKENAIVTCLNGAFEFQNRLIETSDSLLIKNDYVLEMEALSENAILNILEF